MVLKCLHENPSVLIYHALQRTLMFEYLKDMNGCLCEWHHNLASWPSVVADRKADPSGFTEGYEVPTQIYKGVLCLIGSRRVLSHESWCYLCQWRESCWCSARTVVNYRCNRYSSSTSRQDEKKKGDTVEQKTTKAYLRLFFFFWIFQSRTFNITHINWDEHE